MNQIKVGKFIAECRKKADLTQAYLVQKSDKEVIFNLLTKKLTADEGFLIGVFISI